MLGSKGGRAGLGGVAFSVTKIIIIIMIGGNAGALGQGAAPAPPPPSQQAKPTTPSAAAVQPQQVIQTHQVLQAPPAVDPNALSLSLSEALRRAELQSLTVEQSNARLTGASAKLRGAGSLNNPVISLAHGVGQNTGGLDEDILLTQIYELGDKRRQRIREARAEQQAATSGIAAARTDLVFSVQSAYYEATRAAAERQLAFDSLASSKALLNTAQIQHQAGDVPRSNVVRSQIELSRAEQALTAVETDLANRNAALKSLAGVPAASPITLTDTPSFVPISANLESLRALALRQRSDIQSARSALVARQAALHGVRAQTQPDLFLEARHSTIDPTVGGNSLRVGVLLPFVDLGRNRADAAVADAAVREQRAIVAETTRTALLDVETAYRNMEQARKQVEAFQAGRLERSRELLEMARTGYEHGANTLLEYLDAQQVYRTEQTDYARALSAYNIARAALQRAVGGRLQ